MGAPFKFLQPVTVTATISRGEGEKPNSLKWHRDAIARRAGWCIGWRTLSDGIYFRPGRSFNGESYEYDDGEYKATRYFTAVLVVYGERSRPVLCLPADVSPITTKGSR